VPIACRARLCTPCPPRPAPPTSNIPNRYPALGRGEARFAARVGVEPPERGPAAVVAHSCGCRVGGADCVSPEAVCAGPRSPQLNRSAYGLCSLACIPRSARAGTGSSRRTLDANLRERAQRLLVPPAKKTRQTRTVFQRCTRPRMSDEAAVDARAEVPKVKNCRTTSMVDSRAALGTTKRAAEALRRRYRLRAAPRQGHLRSFSPTLPSAAYPVRAFEHA
jgi:hypothetical protein